MHLNVRGRVAVLTAVVVLGMTNVALSTSVVGFLWLAPPLDISCKLNAETIDGNKCQLYTNLIIQRTRHTQFTKVFIWYLVFTYSNTRCVLPDVAFFALYSETVVMVIATNASYNTLVFHMKNVRQNSRWLLSVLDGLESRLQLSWAKQIQQE